MQTRPSPLVLLPLLLAGWGPVHAVRERTQIDPPQGSRDAPVFLSLEADPVEVVANQLFTLRIRFGFRPGFLEHDLVPLFPRRVDLPVQLTAPWSEGLRCAAPIASGPNAPNIPGPTLVFGSDTARATLDPSRPDSYLLERSFRATCGDELLFEGPLLRYATSAAFHEGVLGERVAVDVVPKSLQAASVLVTVRDLPEADRSPEFSGWVGDLRGQARAPRRDLVLGEELTLVLTVFDVTGISLAGLPPLRLPPLPGFRLLGSVESEPEPDAPPGARSFSFDLEPRSDTLRALPAFSIPYYAPAPENRYEQLQLPAIPILIRPAPTTPSPQAQPRTNLPARPSPFENAHQVVAGVVVLAVLFSLSLLLRRRRRRRP